jgi:hypothetical protein
MYDYPETTDTYEEIGNNALRAIHESLNWALSLPSDPEFNELCTFVKNTKSCEGIIQQIRQGYSDPDSLAKIKAAIECMMEE